MKVYLREFNGKMEVMQVITLIEKTDEVPVFAARLLHDHGIGRCTLCGAWGHGDEMPYIDENTRWCRHCHIEDVSKYPRLEEYTAFGNHRVIRIKGD